jgi:hypothetical protein
MTAHLITAELHAHTHYSSDGHIGFEEMTETLSRRHIDLVAITDHDTIEGALEFKKRHKAAATNLHIVVGEEKTLANGTHVIGLWLREEIRSDSLSDTISEIRAQGGVCVLPHPFRHRDGALHSLRGGGPRDLCFELFNPKCNYHENGIARDLLGPDFVPVGGSDAHYASDLGECVNVVSNCGDIDESLRNALCGKSPLAIWGTPQGPGEKGRRYAPLYYRMKPYVRVPRPMVPMAASLYRAYRNHIAKRNLPELELKHESD